jgi:hypothetical protein
VSSSDTGGETVVRARVDSLYSDSVSDLTHWQPDPPDDFGYNVTIDISPVDDHSVETFYVRVCSPKWFARYVSEQGVTSGHANIFATRHDWPEIRSFIETYVHSISADTWEHLVDKMEFLALAADRYPDNPGHHFS